MENMILKLKIGVTPMDKNGVPGLSLAGCTRFAKDARQAALIQALAVHEQPLEALKKLLQTRDGSPTTDADAALVLAAFILDFEEYIEP